MGPQLFPPVQTASPPAQQVTHAPHHKKESYGPSFRLNAAGGDRRAAAAARVSASLTNYDLRPLDDQGWVAPTKQQSLDVYTKALLVCHEGAVLGLRLRIWRPPKGPATLLSFIPRRLSSEEGTFEGAPPLLVRALNRALCDGPRVQPLPDQLAPAQGAAAAQSSSLGTAVVEGTLSPGHQEHTSAPTYRPGQLKRGAPDGNPAPPSKKLATGPIIPPGLQLVDHSIPPVSTAAASPSANIPLLLQQIQQRQATGLFNTPTQQPAAGPSNKRVEALESELATAQQEIDQLRRAQATAAAQHQIEREATSARLSVLEATVQQLGSAWLGTNMAAQQAA